MFVILVIGILIPQDGIFAGFYLNNSVISIITVAVVVFIALSWTVIHLIYLPADEIVLIIKVFVLIANSSQIRHILHQMIYIAVYIIAIIGCMPKAGGRTGAEGRMYIHVINRRYPFFGVSLGDYATGTLLVIIKSLGDFCACCAATIGNPSRQQSVFYLSTRQSSLYSVCCGLFSHFSNSTQRIIQCITVGLGCFVELFGILTNHHSAQAVIPEK